MTINDRILLCLRHGALTTSELRNILSDLDDNQINNRVQNMFNRGIIRPVSYDESPYQWRKTLPHEVESVINMRNPIGRKENRLDRRKISTPFSTDEDDYGTRNFNRNELLHRMKMNDSKGLFPLVWESTSSVGDFKILNHVN